jgi:hypothetical protein
MVVNRRKFLAATMAVLPACGQKLEEASTSFDLKNLLPLLQAVAKLIEAGFGSAEVAKVNAIGHELARGKVSDFAFEIVFRASKGRFTIRLEKEDIDTIDIFFFTPQGLAAEIKKAMRVVQP